MRIGVLALMLLLPTLASADRVHMKNGWDFDVESWREEGDEIVYERFGGQIRVPKRDVERIDRVPRARGAAPSTLPRCDPFDALVSRPVTPCAPAQTAAERCDGNRPRIGEDEAAIYRWATCLGYASSSGQSFSDDVFSVTTTQTQFGVTRLFTIGGWRSGTYIHTHNGRITIIQAPGR
jgi:hypothetical protein